MSWIKNITDEFKNIKSGVKQLREFGFVVGGVLLILGGIAQFRGKAVGPYFLVPGALLALAAAMFPKVLGPLQKVWMGLALVIGFFMSRVVLFVLFFLVLTPIGLLMRLFGKDMLDERLDKAGRSYWIERTEKQKAKESYENQY